MTPGARATSPAIGWIDITEDVPAKRLALTGRIAMPWLVSELAAIEAALAAGKTVRALRLLRKILRSLTAPREGR